SRTRTSTPARARRYPSIMPGGPPPATQHRTRVPFPTPLVLSGMWYSAQFATRTFTVSSVEGERGAAVGPRGGFAAGGERELGILACLRPARLPNDAHGRPVFLHRHASRGGRDTLKVITVRPSMRESWT